MPLDSFELTPNDEVHDFINTARDKNNIHPPLPEISSSTSSRDPWLHRSSNGQRSSPGCNTKRSDTNQESRDECQNRNNKRTTPHDAPTLRGLERNTSPFGVLCRDEIVKTNCLQTAEKAAQWWQYHQKAETLSQAKNTFQFSEKAVDGFVFSQRDDPTRTSRAFLEDSGQRRERNTPGRLCLHNFSECNRRINYETSWTSASLVRSMNCERRTLQLRREQRAPDKQAEGIGPISKSGICLSLRGRVP